MRPTFILPGVSAGAEGTGAAVLEVGELAVGVGSGAPYCAAARAGSRRTAKAVVNMVLSRWTARRVGNKDEVHRVAKKIRGVINESTSLRRM